MIKILVDRKEKEGPLGRELEPALSIISFYCYISMYL